MTHHVQKLPAHRGACQLGDQEKKPHVIKRSLGARKKGLEESEMVGTIARRQPLPLLPVDPSHGSFCKAILLTSLEYFIAFHLFSPFVQFLFNFISLFLPKIRQMILIVAGSFYMKPFP